MDMMYVLVDGFGIPLFTVLLEEKEWLFNIVDHCSRTYFHDLFDI